jgi:RNA polymerase II-associated factor 1
MDKPPVLHAADRALMRAPNALGKQTSGASGISFLRRTEYTTAHHMGGMKFESSNSSNTMRLKTKRRRPADLSKDDPRNISKHILKGFNIAYPADAYNGPDTEDKIRAAEATSEEKQAWRAPKHPTNHSVHVVDSYPLLPDWDALPDTGAYMLYKFVMPPVRTKEYDDRLDVALLRPAGRSVDDEDLYFREKEERMHDPSLPDPIPRYHFEFFLPADNAKVRGIKRNLSTYDPDNEEDISFDAGVDEEGRPKKYFKYENIRTYETSNQVGNLTEPYSDVVAVSLHDPESHPDDPLRTSKLQKAAYFYPIAQRTNIRPKQTAGVVMVDGEQPKVDIIEAVGRDPDAEIEKREAIHKRYDVVEA